MDKTLQNERCCGYSVSSRSSSDTKLLYFVLVLPARRRIIEFVLVCRPLILLCFLPNLTSLTLNVCNTDIRWNGQDIVTLIHWKCWHTTATILVSTEQLI